VPVTDGGGAHLGAEGGLLALLGRAAPAPHTWPSNAAAWSTLVELAIDQRVAAPLINTIGDSVSALPEPARTRLQQAALVSGRRSLMAFRDRDVITRVLAHAGVPVIVLKGGDLMDRVYPRISAREMVDLDLLVPAVSMDRAAGILQEQGYTFLTPYLPANEPSTQHLPRLMRHDSVPIELHVGLTPPASPIRINLAGIWERSRPAPGAATYRVMAAEDLLLYLCVHAAYLHAAEFGLRPLCDVEAVVRSLPSLDWAVVVTRAREWRCTRGTYLTLQLAVACLAAAVPASVLTELRPAGHDPSIDTLAREHLFTRKSLSLALPVAVSRAIVGSGLQERLRLAWKGWLIPRPALVAEFPAAERSPIPAWYYARRGWALLQRHGRRAWEGQHAGDGEVTNLMQRRETLGQWLDREHQAR